MALALGMAAAGCAGVESGQPAEPPTASTEERTASTVIMGPEDADHFWVFAESKDRLGSGGDLEIYVDPVKFPDARGGFAKFALGVGGALPVHRHDKTEEIGYFLAGEGIVTVFEDGNPRDVPVKAGHVFYIQPGAWHTIRNTGDEPFSLVFATIPNERKGLLSLFRRIGVKPGEEAVPLGPEEFARLAAEHDLILRPPEASPPR